MAAPSSSPNVKEGPQVFINFRGAELRKTFISHLESALKRIGINAYIDSNEPAGENLHKLFERIEESNVALAILSSRYTESNWCLKELVKIMECVEQDNLWVIPIFYKLDPGTVKGLDGDFGIQLWDLWRKTGRNRDDRILKWDAALQGVTSKFGLVWETSRFTGIN
ncbi:PREDICTED: disease resistance-like protein CSA1 isoform X2 [Camelina sativa]|uniref:Disease resistance-like protein CSA1 isoform X2 n=1 Tax=Camelina sativa TaxID=90675 RepID=A0ABM0X6V0_CAMSA|nr:PREDICTED: disease resistance-like protein CSA1 isoform X2 [Camelina sativa]